MSRHVIIGDVHGCLDELVELLELVGLRAVDTLTFVGDLLDRGPASGEVVRLVRALADNQRVNLVMGNHERKHVRFRQGKGEAPDYDTDQFMAVSAQLTDDDIAYLASGVKFLPLPEHRSIVVHGGISPSVVLPGGEPLTSKQRHALVDLMYLRSLPDGMFWAWAYDGRFGHCFFGHQPFRRPAPMMYPYATGLDLGCCFGGRMAAAILEVGRPTQFVSVASRQPVSKFYEEG